MRDRRHLHPDDPLLADLMLRELGPTLPTRETSDAAAEAIIAGMIGNHFECPDLREFGRARPVLKAETVH